MDAKSLVISNSELKRIERTFNPLPKKVEFRLASALGPFFARLVSPLLGLGKIKDNILRLKETFMSLKDGTKLATDIYLPEKMAKNHGKCPTILVRLPYWKDSLSIIGYIFAAHGYAVVMQDIRGCARSEGANCFLLTDRYDGLETLAWISKKFWYNGKIGTLGGSYFGMTQWAISWDNNGLLTCLNPAVSTISNVWKNNQGLQLNELNAETFRTALNVSKYYYPPRVDDTNKIVEELIRKPSTHLYNDPIEGREVVLSLEEMAGKSCNEILNLFKDRLNVDIDPAKKDLKTLYNVLKQVFLDRKVNKEAYKYTQATLNMDLKKLTSPVLLLSGWHDLFTELAIKDFKNIRKYASGDAKKFSRLIIGSWSHADVGHPESVYFNGGMIDFYKDFFSMYWFDHWLKGKDVEEIDKPRIRIWVMGRNRWRYENEWPPERVRYKKIYLHSNGNANSKYGDGKLSWDVPKDEVYDKFIFNPLDPVITFGGRNLSIARGALNQKKSEKRNDVLVYTSARLEKGIEVTGPGKIILYASSSAIDTDFMVKLVDVYPNGRKALNILDFGIRARFRDGELKNPSLIEPRKIYKYEINLGNTSNFFRPGHRIRIDITSSNFPRFDINSNLGGQRNKKGYILAEQNIFHNKEFPSRVILPIINDK